MQAKIEAVKAKVAQCIKLAEQKFGITMPAVQIRFDLRGRAAGMAGCQQNRWTGASSNFYLRFNVQHMALGGQSWEHILNDTVPHEVAHTVCQAFPKFGRQHNDGWKRVCVALGGNGSRCYSAEDAPEAVAKARPFAYTTSTGHIVAVSPIIHKKIQTMGASYTWRGKGKVSKGQPFTVTQASMLASPTKPIAPVAPIAPVVRTVQHTPAASKADAIRAYLAQSKKDVGSEAFERTIAWAVETLGMTRTLARTYTKNNWGKV